MDYNMKKAGYLVIIAMIYIAGCKEKSINTGNIFYVDYKTANDSFMTSLKKVTSGKVGYHDNEKRLQIVSADYLTEDHPDIHYFRVMDEMPINPEVNTIRYDVSFNGSMINDSIAYTVTKMIFNGKNWQEKSLLGTIKVFDFLSPRDKYLRIIKDNVAYKVFKTIVEDTYAR